MNPIKTLIVDDEINGRENLRGILNKYCPEVNIISEASSALEAIREIQAHQPELVFLDIEMPGGNGFEVLKSFSRPNFQVIFVTAYDQYAIQAIRFSALDYILKPIDSIQLMRAVQRFEHQKTAWHQRLEVFLKNQSSPYEDKKIALTFSDKIDFVEIKRIIKCEGEGGYTRFHLDNKTALLTSKPLVEYEELLSEYEFFRTHKTYLVNTAHISSFIKSEGGYLLMSDDSHVPVSRRKKEDVLSYLKKRQILIRPLLTDNK